MGEWLSGASWTGKREQVALAPVLLARANPLAPVHKPACPCPRCAARLYPSRYRLERAQCLACGFVAFQAPRVDEGKRGASEGKRRKAQRHPITLKRPATSAGEGKGWQLELFGNVLGE